MRFSDVSAPKCPIFSIFTVVLLKIGTYGFRMINQISLVLFISVNL